MSTAHATPAVGKRGHPHPRGMTILLWVLQIAAAVILLQTLYFKFTGAPESKYIFTKLGAEPWGRYGSGAMELVAAAMLLIPKPRLNALGALLAVGLMLGAIGSHLTKLGIKIPSMDTAGILAAGDDGGLLFTLACVVFVCAAVVVIARRKSLPVVGKRF